MYPKMRGSQSQGRLGNMPLQLRSLRRACIFWCSHNCPDCPLNSEVWIAFFALSCLSTSLPVGATSNIQEQEVLELQCWIKNYTERLRGCNTMLYTPHIDKEELKSCREMIMQCFLLEIEVMMFETEVPDTDQNIESRKNYTLLRQLPQSRCKLCELHDMTNSTVFLETFQDFLKMIVNQIHS
ncbi:interleukin-15 isoform X2 [Paramormyrops kingsleyae]|uniref:interleukin-15 isoform X2 n=1 Tax=Paramormyrops kingsleyae TaxID=1676925 RepID=UPI000CD649AA|nr:interleukin-15-like isoform X2 [Paramormyrops kingsleyae]